jgi:hypothetical protein
MWCSRRFALVFGVVFLTATSALAAPARWYVYSDGGASGNHGEWTNYMPAEAGKMIKLSLVDTDRPHLGKTCIKAEVQWRAPFWCGVAVSSLPDFWGEKEGKAFDLRKAKRLVFHARGARGGEVVQFKVAIAGDKPFGDSARSPASTEWLRLTRDWQRYELDVSGLDLSRVVTPFCFVTSRDYNRGNISFFLDEIYFEME